MTAVITALVGLVGVLVGVLFASLLQRRTWQRQEAMKTYAELFTTGNDVLRFCTGLWIELGNLNALVDNHETIARARVSNPDLGTQHQVLEKTYGDFKQTEDRVFRHLVIQCWMLERDPVIRRSIKAFEQKYLACQVTLRMLFGRLSDKRKGSMDKVIAKRPTPDSLFETLEQLQNQVAGKYFHDSPCEAHKE